MFISIPQELASHSQGLPTIVTEDVDNSNSGSQHRQRSGKFFRKKKIFSQEFLVKEKALLTSQWSCFSIGGRLYISSKVVHFAW